MSAPPVRALFRCAIHPLLLLLLFLLNGAGAASLPTIAYFEKAQGLVIQRKVGNEIPDQVGSPREVLLAFSAFGQTMRFELMPNDRLLHGLRSSNLISDRQASIYRGVMPKVPGSWGRFSIADGKIAGVVWDGHELYIVDRASNLASYVQQPSNFEETLVVRASDIYFPIDQPMDGGGTAKTPASDALERAASSLHQRLGAPTRAISLGLVLDYELHRSFTDPVHIALTRANIADGIFSAQANIHLDLQYIESFATEADPFTGTDPAGLLDQLAQLKTNTPALASLGMVHLLTRIELDGDVLGIARLRSICGPDAGVGLTETRGSVIDALIMAHEIGHNFGAPHDGEAGSACQSTPPTFLMAANFSGSSEFSPCSRSQISAMLNDASCLIDVGTSEIELTMAAPPTSVHYKEPLGLTYFVNNIGLASTFDGLIDISAGADATVAMSGATDRRCENLAPQPSQSCNLGNLYSGETVTVEVHVVPDVVGQLSVNAVASASNDTNASNNSKTLELEVLPATDVQADGINNVSINVRPGDVVSYTAIAVNNGDFDTLSSIILSVGGGHRLTSPSNCMSISDQRLECDLGVLAAGGTQSIEFDLIADDTPLDLTDFNAGYVDYELTTTLHDLQPIGNFTQFPFAVWGSIRDLQVGFITPPKNVEVGQTGTFIVFLGNNGPDASAGVHLNIGVEAGVTFDSATPETGACTTGEGFIDCELGLVGVGEAFEIEVSYIGDVAGTYGVGMSHQAAGGWELDNTADVNFATFDVEQSAPPPPPSPPPPDTGGGSGGGGHTSALWLVILGIFSLTQRPSIGPSSVRTGIVFVAVLLTPFNRTMHRAAEVEYP